MYKIGIDVGGMSIKGGIVKNGEIIGRLTVKTNIGNVSVLVNDIENLVNEMLKNENINISEIESIGIGFPGVVTKDNKVTCVNLGIINEPLVEKLEKIFENTKIAVGNDANVAALAEYFYGSMKNFESGVMITLGTGIGGGIVINNKLITGANGIGAEIGHIVIGENYYNCNCGNNGCFETFCSATAIIKHTQKLISEGNESIIKEMCNNNLDEITAKMVFDAYKENDEVAKIVIERFRKYLALGLANIVNFIDPDVISIGGGVSNASELILENLTENIKKHLPFKESKICDIVIAKFKNDAGIIGASSL